MVLKSVFNANAIVVDSGIYFVPGLRGEDHSTIQFFRFADRELINIDALTGVVGYGFAVSPDRRSLLYSQYDTRGSDLWTIEKYR
jgi:hypothetical protein